MKNLQLEMKEIEIESYKKQIQCLMQKNCDPIPQTSRPKLKPEQKTDQGQEHIKLIEKHQKTIEVLQLDLQAKEEDISKLQSEIVSLKMKQESNKKYYVEETILLDAHLEEENRKLKQQLQEEREKFECHKNECQTNNNKLRNIDQVNSETQTESLTFNDDNWTSTLRSASASNIEEKKSAQQDHEIKQEILSSIENSQSQDNISEEHRVTIRFNKRANENENANEVSGNPSKRLKKTVNKSTDVKGQILLHKIGKNENQSNLKKNQNKRNHKEKQPFCQHQQVWSSDQQSHANQKNLKCHDKDDQLQDQAPLQNSPEHKTTLTTDCIKEKTLPVDDSIQNSPEHKTAPIMDCMKEELLPNAELNQNIPEQHRPGDKREETPFTFHLGIKYNDSNHTVIS